MSDYTTLIRPTGAHSGVVALRDEIDFPGYRGNATFLTDRRVRRKIEPSPQPSRVFTDEGKSKDPGSPIKPGMTEGESRVGRVSEA